MSRPVILAAHDPQWSDLAAQESARISDVLRSILVAIHHIGSTAVPGIKAKPVIDLLVVVTDLDALDLQASALSEIGYQPRGDFGIPGRRFFTKDTSGLRSHHLHCFAAGDPHIERHLLFRDYLRAHPESATQYQEFKEALAVRFSNDSEAYAEAKTPFIEQIIMLARSEKTEG